MKEKIIAYYKKYIRLFVLSCFTILFSTTLLFMTAFGSSFIINNTLLSLPYFITEESINNNYGKITMRINANNHNTLDKIKNDLLFWHERNHYGNAYKVYEKTENKINFNFQFNQETVPIKFVDAFSHGSLDYYNNLNIQAATNNGWSNLHKENNVYISSNLADKLFSYYKIENVFGYGALIGHKLPSLNDSLETEFIIGGVYNSLNIQAQYYSVLLSDELIFAAAENLLDFTPTYLGVDFARSQGKNNELILYLDVLQKKYGFTFDFYFYSNNIDNNSILELRRLEGSKFYSSILRTIIVFLSLLFCLVFVFETVFSMYNIYITEFSRKTHLILSFVLPVISYFISLFAMLITGWLYLNSNLMFLISAPINIYINTIILIIILALNLLLYYFVQSKKNSHINCNKIVKTQ